MKSRFCVLLLCGLMMGCGGGDSSPTAPTPSIGQFGGVWRAAGTLQSVATADCIGPPMQSAVGVTGESTFRVTQTGSFLTGLDQDMSTGFSCTYNGTAGTSTATFNMVSCDWQWNNLVCPNGLGRDLSPIAGNVTMTLSGNTATGSSSLTFDIWSHVTRTVVGTVSLTQRMSFTRQ